MKPAPLDYACPDSLAKAAALLREGGEEARLLAGGQSLGPMLNLRLARPRLLIDVTRIPELNGVEETADAVILGAGVTHAAIEDRQVPDIGAGVLYSIAGGIAYRAVRNRGTIGGSLCHADPAADWVSALTALDAAVVTHRHEGGNRLIALKDFVAGAFATALAPGEIVAAIRIPRLSRRARWGWYKVCRKPGEFADAIAAVLDDPERDVRHVVIGATGGAPLLLSGAAATPEAAEGALSSAGLDPIDRQIHRVALRRAFAMERA